MPDQCFLLIPGSCRFVVLTGFFSSYPRRYRARLGGLHSREVIRRFRIWILVSWWIRACFFSGSSSWFKKKKKKKTWIMKWRNLFNGITLRAFLLNRRKRRHQFILVQRDTRLKFQITINTALNNTSRAVLSSENTLSLWLAHHTVDIH